MPSSARISVVVPAYNHERFVGEALESALGQSHAPLEIVVVDDGSTDGTAEIVAGYARSDARIRLICQRNRGSHAAINRAIAESTGEWIAVLNSDDRFAPTRLQRLAEFCEGRFDFAVSDVRLIDALGDPVDDPSHWLNAKLADFRSQAREAGPVGGLLYGNYAVSTSNFFLRRQLFEAIGPLRHFRHILDWDYALRAALHAPQRFGYLAGEVLLDYRLHGGNAILRDTLRGALEIAHMQRQRLPRFGAPPAVVRSLFLAQRDVRRSARDRAVGVAERFVREREADIARNLQEIAQLHSRLVAVYEDLNAARAKVDELGGMLSDRETRLHDLDTRLRDREAQLAERDAQLEHCRDLLRDREDKLDRFRASLPGRMYALYKRLGGR